MVCANGFGPPQTTTGEIYRVPVSRISRVRECPRTSPRSHGILDQSADQSGNKHICLLLDSRSCLVPFLPTQTSTNSRIRTRTAISTTNQLFARCINFHSTSAFNFCYSSILDSSIDLNHTSSNKITINQTITQLLIFFFFITIIIYRGHASR